MKKFFFAFLSCTFLLVSCGKDGKDGAVGPQGPQGATGAQGNTNVQATTITFNAADWQSGGNHWRAIFTVPAITQAIYDKGTVHIYLNSGANAWFPLTFTTFPSQGSNISQVWTPFHLVGGAEVKVTNSDGALPTKPGNAIFKIVTIAPGLHKMPKVDWNNYAEVARVFNLPE
jgi:hypothetical protein